MITLTEQEVQFILNEVAARDPIMRLLMQKQLEAQRERSPEPMEVPMRGSGANGEARDRV